MKNLLARPLVRSAPLAFTSLLLAACSGGGDGGGSSGLTDVQRAQAALITAESTTNACMPIRPFYWEIGDVNFAKTSGSVGGTTYIAGTAMPIASATKWLYASYVAELRAGVMTAPDIKFLNFQSGYTNFGLCLPGQTVDTCLALGTNGTYSAVTDGKFLYDGGHMQKHASLNGLGNMDKRANRVSSRPPTRSRSTSRNWRAAPTLAADLR